MKQTPYVFFFSTDTTSSLPSAGLRPKLDCTQSAHQSQFPSTSSPTIIDSSADSSSSDHIVPDDTSEDVLSADTASCRPTKGLGLNSGNALLAQSTDRPQLPRKPSMTTSDLFEEGRGSSAHPSETMLPEIDLISFKEER